MSIRVTAGSVFDHLGFNSGEAASLKVRAKLMTALRKHIERNGLTQTATAKLMGVSQPRISNLMKGHIHLFSADTLIEMAGRAGLQVKVSIGTGIRTGSAAIAARTSKRPSKN